MKTIDPKGGEGIADEEENKERKEAIRAWVNIIIQGVLALVTIGLFLVATYEAKEAEKNTKLVEQNFRIENRAWVGLSSLPKTGTDYGMCRGQSFNITIKNFGKTPADSLRHGDTLFFSNGLPKPKIIGISKESRVFSPNESTSFVIPIPKNFSDTLIEKIKRGKTRLFVYSIITYKDIYGIVDTTEFIGVYDTIWKNRFNPYGIDSRMK